MMNEARFVTEEFQISVTVEPAATWATGCNWLPLTAVAIKLSKKNPAGKVVTRNDVNEIFPSTVSLTVMVVFPGFSTVGKSKISTTTEAPPLRTTDLAVWGCSV